jgi:hypothetical protein
MCEITVESNRLIEMCVRRNLKRSEKKRKEKVCMEINVIREDTDQHNFSMLSMFLT